MTSSTRQNTTTTRGLGLDSAEPRSLSKRWPVTDRNLIMLLCSIDVWNIYLHFRQLEFVLKNADVPEVLADVISQVEYSETRRHAVFFTLAATCSLLGRLQFIMFNVTDRYAPMIWSLTKDHSQSSDTRAIIYSAIEDFASKAIVVLIAVLVSSLLYRHLKVSPLEAAFAGVVWLLGSATTTALRTTVMVKGTNIHGGSFFFYLYQFYQIAIIVGHIVFIEFLAPFMLHGLPEGPAKSTIDSVALKAGYYPHHAVYFEPNPDPSLGRSDPDANAYHAGLLGASMIVISERLLKIVGPTDIGAVVGHELGHWKYSHSTCTFIVSALANFCFILTSIWAYDNKEVCQMFGDFDEDDPPHPMIGVILTSKYYFPILGGFIMGLRGILGYFCEFAADGFAVKLGLGKELRNSLVSLISTIKVFPGVDSWYAAWFRGHPSMVLRIEELT